MNELKDIKIFADAGVDQDTDDSLMQPNRFRQLRNLICEKQVAEILRGTYLVSNTNLPAGRNVYLGGRYDGKSNTFVFFLYNENGNHGIYRYDNKKTDSSAITPICISAYFNFQEDYKINHIDIIGDLCYWSDGYINPTYLEGLENNSREHTIGAMTNENPPRKLNLRKAENLYQKSYDSVELWYAGGTYSVGDHVLYLNKIWKCVVAIPSGYYNQIPGTGSKWQYVEYYDSNHNYLSIDKQTLDRIKYPPQAPALKDGSTQNANGTTIDVIDGYGSDPDVDYNKLRGKIFTFRTRYIYDDNEKSVWSEYSRVPLPEGIERTDGSFLEDNSINNVIALEVSMGNFDVVAVEIAVRDGNVGVWKVVGRLEKYYSDGKVNTKYKSNSDYTWLFYNEVDGEVLDQDDTARPFDYVPIWNKAQKLVDDNRIVDGGIIEGYGPTDIDIDLELAYEKLSLTETETNLGVVLRPLPDQYVWVFIPATVIPNSIYTIRIYESPVAGNGYWGPNFTNGPVTIRTVSHIASPTDTAVTIASKLRSKIFNTIGYPTQYRTDNIVSFWPIRNAPSGAIYVHYTTGYINTVSETHKSFKAGAYLPFGIVYYDRAGRYGPVNKIAELYNPFFNQMYSDGLISTNEAIHKTKVNFQINETRFVKPPEWASYYQFVFARENIGYFADFMVKGSDVMYSDDSTKIHVVINKNLRTMRETFNNTNIDDYVWEKGDRIRFVMKKKDEGGAVYTYFDQLYDFEILNQFYDDDEDAYAKDEAGSFWAYRLDEKGNKIRNTSAVKLVVSLFDIEKIFNFTNDVFVVVQVYRPRKKDADEDLQLYYEIGERYAVDYPGTSYRSHSVRGGTLNGNIFVKARNNSIDLFPCESRWYSDYYDSQIDYFGRVTIYDRDMRQRLLKAVLRWSGRFLENTLINELSKVKYDSYESLTEQNGIINIMDQRGYMLKVKQETKITSIYIGRVVVKQGDENNPDVLSTVDKVIGTKIPSESRYGCLDPESYVNTGTYGYFIDVLNGVILRDAMNGMFPISDYGIKIWTRDKCQYLLESCSEYWLFGGYDSEKNHVYFTFAGKDSATGSWDITTWIFNENKNTWFGPFDFLPASGDPHEGFGQAGKYMLSFYGGNLYKHGLSIASPGKFYGVQQYPVIEFIANNEPALTKVFRSMAIYSNLRWYAPNYGDVYVPVVRLNGDGSVNSDAIMQTRIPKEYVALKEGLFWAKFGRGIESKTRNGSESTDSQKARNFLNGNELRGELASIKLTAIESEFGENSKISKIIVNSKHSKRSGQ